VKFDRLGEHPESRSLRVADGGPARVQVLRDDRAVIFVAEFDALLVGSIVCCARRSLFFEDCSDERSAGTPLYAAGQHRGDLFTKPRPPGV
jgi:hypothetical protein